MRRSALAVFAAVSIAGAVSSDAGAAPSPVSPAGVQAAGSQGQQAREEGPRPYAEVVTGEAESDEGLFTVHRIGEDYFFEIPESLYGRDMLLMGA